MKPRYARVFLSIWCVGMLCGLSAPIRAQEPVAATAEEKHSGSCSDLLLLQANRYRELFNLFKEEAKKGIIDTVVLWGCAGDDTWLDSFPVQARPDAPLLFDRRLQAKPAFWGIVDPSKM
jgi:endo-1,4-beta-xylanase